MKRKYKILAHENPIVASNILRRPLDPLQLKHFFSDASKARHSPPETLLNLASCQSRKRRLLQWLKIASIYFICKP